MRLDPLGEMIVVEPFKAEENTKSGFFIPPDAREKPTQGTVVAAGPDAEVPIGSIVLHGKYSGSEFKLDEKDYLLMRASEIFGTLRPLVEGSPGVESDMGIIPEPA